MLSKPIFNVILLIVFFMGIPKTHAQQDIAGSEDHPMVSRYAGAVIKGYEQAEYDRAIFPSGLKDRELQTIAAEGKRTRVLYVGPPQASVLEVQRNYQHALRNAGFDIVYECFGGMDQIPRQIYTRHSPGDMGISGRSPYMGTNASYFLARLKGAEGSIYVSAHTLNSSRFDDQVITALQILEEVPMQTGKVQVDISAEAMALDIDQTGSVSIYGIYFDIDRASIKAESAPVLAEIASLLKNNPDLNLHVVGHTDATGSLSHNMDLSKRRAMAVVDYLTNEHGISTHRLQPHGIASLAPVASNLNEDGRARNRRVALVKAFN